MFSSRKTHKKCLIVPLPVTDLRFEKWAQTLKIQNSAFIVPLVESCGNFEAHMFPAFVSSYKVLSIPSYVERSLFSTQENINKY